MTKDILTQKWAYKQNDTTNIQGNNSKKSKTKSQSPPNRGVGGGALSIEKEKQCVEN